MEKEPQWMVYVNCATYNHAPYITDALNGFTMQETTFPYVCGIIDDASTDGEQEVIKNYLQEHFDLEDTSIVRNEETEDYTLTFARHKTNKNCYFAVLYLKYNHYSIKKSKEPYIKEWNDQVKYIASCEGDDYWTASHKLQIQYDYLETHPSVMLSCHRYSIFDVKTGEAMLAGNPYFDQRCHRQENQFEFDKNYFLNTWVTKTLTCMVRKDAIEHNYSKGFKYARDVHYFYYILTKGRGVCHAFNGGVYRKNVSTSIFGNLSRAAQAEINAKVYEELAERTKDPLVRKAADRAVVADCANRLRNVGGGYFFAIQIIMTLNRVVKIVKRIQPIS